MMVIDRKLSKFVVFFIGMVFFVYVMVNFIIYGIMSMCYRWVYRRVFNVVCCFCGRRLRLWSFLFLSISELVYCF